MIKLFCDDCGKEIEDNDYVEQSVLVHYAFDESAEMVMCKDCWESQMKKFEELSK